MDEFDHLLNNIDVHQTWYARAYATNLQGTSYDDQVVFITAPVVGDLYQVGIVFYLNNNGGGLVCAPSDQSADAMWGCYGQFIGLTSTAFGMGNFNTTAIVSNCDEDDTAARLCNELVFNQYDDWFLPSINELNAMFSILKKNGLGNFANVVYWSSSEINANRSWAVGFGNGVSVEANKAAGYRVRAIRSY
jgi:hypothetical protein